MMESYKDYEIYDDIDLEQYDYDYAK